MTKDNKESEYSLMEHAPKMLLTVRVKKGPIITVNCWDYKADLTTVQFKTNAEIKEEHPLLKIEKIDLTPITTKKLWKVTIFKQEPSNLKK